MIILRNEIVRVIVAPTLRFFTQYFTVEAVRTGLPN